jgi:hypothetical protein
MNYYNYNFQFCGVVQMMIIDKKKFNYVLDINNIWKYWVVKILRYFGYKS